MEGDSITMAGDTVSVARDIITMTEEKVGIGQKTRSVWQLSLIHI